MQWLARVCVRRPVFAVMLIMAMVVAGASQLLMAWRFLRREGGLLRAAPADAVPATPSGEAA